jgi:hypothetical protein
MYQNLTIIYKRTNIYSFFVQQKIIYQKIFQTYLPNHEFDHKTLLCIVFIYQIFSFMYHLFFFVAFCLFNVSFFIFIINDT